ncbi:TolB family protein, partial [Klebsiella pneumoniae]|uniref:TolB family protein n=1 Tax=Klebsiella pneumoniae TaxID=573 RepID=UPI003F51B8A7
TEGAWTDTMCNWSPDGEWIAFASDRHDPGSGSFEIYLIHPDGTGLRKLIQNINKQKLKDEYKKYKYNTKAILYRGSCSSHN